ncbi:type II toxin-antitoxin system HicB family antitoxin [Methylobacterium sp. Leaf106]|uniref:type II toxin-antitoxin system HicB family antitoxin n=1 Tax=Methylobacterium sp. Leaf106 TaxID=1736255 RepID=UPI0006F4DF20|nr:type II toxin-antitoxin system HicB family antitoxin [Methylobacterium sp. Leaf106]KQP53046.1 transcriptional regulator [Methylobacterium sp. Leaf106]
MIGYRIELEPDDNGSFLVTCPALPEVTTFGDDEFEARIHAADAIEEALGGRIASGEAIPPFEDDAGAIRLSLQTKLKVVLYRELLAAGMTRADLMRRLQWNRESVDRLFRLDHASRIDQIDIAMTALGREVDPTVRQAA